MTKRKTKIEKLKEQIPELLEAAKPFMQEILNPNPPKSIPLPVGALPWTPPKKIWIRNGGGYLDYQALRSCIIGVVRSSKDNDDIMLIFHTGLTIGLTGMNARNFMDLWEKDFQEEEARYANPL